MSDVLPSGALQLTVVFWDLLTAHASFRFIMCCNTEARPHGDSIEPDPTKR